METGFAVEGNLHLVACGLNLRPVDPGDGFVRVDDEQFLVQRCHAGRERLGRDVGRDAHGPLAGQRRGGNRAGYDGWRGRGEGRRFHRTPGGRRLLDAGLYLERARKECRLEGGENFVALHRTALENAAGPGIQGSHLLFGLAVFVTGEHTDKQVFQFVVVTNFAKDVDASNLRCRPVDEQGIKGKIVEDVQSWIPSATVSMP